MKSQQFIQIVDTLKLDNSKLYKIDVLQKHWHNESFKQFLKYIYDPNFLIGVKEKFDYNVLRAGGVELFDVFDKMLEIYDTKAHSKKTWKPFYDSLNYTSMQCFNMLIKKSMECGVDISSLNKVEENFIFQMPMMLANTYNDKTSKHIKFPALLQHKADGIRCNIIIDNGKVINMLSREGKEFDKRCNTIFENDVKDIKFKCVLDGEIVFYDSNNNPLDRKTSNGLSNKCIQHTITDEELKGIKFICWDIIEYDDFIKGETPVRDYEKLMKGIKQIFENNERIIPIHTCEVQSIEEVLELSAQYIKDGMEGAMLKNKAFSWEDKRSNNMLKIKEFETMELIAVEFIEGIGKYEGMLGSIKCQSKDGSIVVNVGTGFSDEQRKQLWKDRRDLLNTPIEVGYNKIIESKTDKKKSLFLPVFIKLRPHL